MTESYQVLAQNFVNFYYSNFITKNWSQLGSIFLPNSLMTYDSKELLGTEAILSQLSSLPFSKEVKYNLTLVQVQPGQSPELILIAVLGRFQDGQDAPIGFSQFFQLKKESNGWFCTNTLFHLHFHNC